MRCIYIFFSILFLLGGGMLYAQRDVVFDSEYTVEYEVKGQLDSTNLSSVITEKMKLFIGKNYSLYENALHQKLDSLTKSKEANNDRTYDFLSIPRFKIKHRILKDYNRNEMIFYEFMQTVNVAYYEKMDLIDWKIHRETQKINGYSCIKATGEFRGRKYTAWFNKEVPFREGPFKFVNLPGLIFEIYDDKDYFHFTLLSLKKEHRKIFIDKSKFKMIDREHFFQYKMNYLEDLQYRAKSKRKTPIITNPIELN